MPLPAPDRRANLDSDLSAFGLEVIEETDRRLQAIIIGSAIVVVIAAIAGFVTLSAR
jgi:hypothetical protein